VATTTSAQQILKKAPMDSFQDVPAQYWELLNRYRDELTAQAASILGGAADAEDVVQETFCEALKNTQQMSNADSLGAWLRTVNRCNALNRMRSQSRDKKKSERMIRLDPPNAHTTGGFSGVELRDTVGKALAGLPANMREIVKLRYWENLSYKEIAERVKLPQGTVGRILCEASLLLYEEMKPQIEKDAPPGTPIS
jgi:RNA polymerase sigma-70 factor (ECF subfamily)